MGQTLKEEVRQRILGAALDEFARLGYAGSGLGAIASRAGVSAGNIYRYFPGKEALFLALFPDSAVAAMREGFLVKFRAMAGLDLDDPRARAAEDELGPRLVEWMAERRRELLVLVTGSDGTVHEGFGQQLADDLAGAWAAWQASRGRPDPGPGRELLAIIYRNLIRIMAELLRRDLPRADLVRDSLGCLAYHMAGIRQLEHRREAGASGGQQ
jgi:AcrR family transcriptional regulator